jgi:abequosyltransferase
VRLTICIPTFNRAEFLPATLDSIAAQWGEDLEIAIADNASTDGTSEIVDQYRERLGAVRYFRWDANQGADRNYLKAVELATGDWCWLLGSDDPILPGAIDALRRVIVAQQSTIVLFNRLLATKDLRPIREDRFLDVRGAAGAQFDFKVAGALERYLEQARSMCATFSYLSSMAFEKRAWDAVPTDEDVVGTAYVHSYKLLMACKRGAVLEYLNHPLVYCRLGNDAFRDLGLAKRVLLDLKGYQLLAERCFGDDQPLCARALVRVLRYEYPWARVMRYQGVLGSDPHWPEILESLRSRVGYFPLALPLATLLGRWRALVNVSFYLRDLRQRWLGRAERARTRLVW